MLHVTTPKDLTTALVKMDLKATGETAQVSLHVAYTTFFGHFAKAPVRQNTDFQTEF